MRITTMRGLAISLACALQIGFLGAAGAQEEAAEESAGEETAEAPEAEAPEEEAAEESESGGFLSDYGNDVKNTFLGGLNGIITWPADPVMLAANPTEDMQAMPGAVVTAPVTGFLAGTLQGVFRLMGGTLDLLVAPFYIFPTFSPEPRYKLIPGWEHAG